MKRIAVIIYGPPGSGKSTQAELVADALGLVRFDTGKYIAAEIYDPKKRNNKTVQRQKKLYELGRLCERPWVYKIVIKQIKRIIGAGYGVVLGGSPRDTYEAFDGKGRDGVYTVLGRGYGKKNVFTFLLTVSPKSSIFRNKDRKICTVCRKPILFIKGCSLPHCPFCGGALKKRKDDKVSVIKDRLIEFERQTMPVIEGLRKRRHKIHIVNGENAPYRVLADIRKWLP